jgi:hypothetical protein
LHHTLEAVGSRRADIGEILARRHDNGADYWTTPDGRVYVGNPYSTISSLCMLHELGLEADHEAVAGGLGAIIGCVRPDGRIRLAPKAPLYPCYTAEATRTLCRFGLTDSPAVRSTITYLLGAVHEGGGWRCTFSRFGKGPETQCANPGATLYALDVLRFVGELRAGVASVDTAVEFLLQHWVTRRRIGPCHWGIGEKFLQVEFPFLRYNVFYYVYVLSFFERARGDVRFLAAKQHLEAAVDEEGRLVVEQTHRGLKGLSFCAKGEPSSPATARYEELRTNLAP